MSLIRKFQKILAMPLAVLMLFSTFSATVVQAKMVGTDEVIAEQRSDVDREKIVNFMSRDDVQAEMQSLGIDPDEAMSRVATLSDQEVQQVAGKLDQLPAGEGAVGSIIGAIVLIFLVLLITDLLCLTNVFDFTRCAR